MKTANAKLWLMGAAAVLGMGKATAQNATQNPNSIPVNPIDNVKPISPAQLIIHHHPEQIDATSPFVSSIYSYLDSLTRYPKTDEFIEKIQELGPIHKIHVDTICVEQPGKISHVQAAYNPRKDSIVVYLNQIPDYLTERRYLNGAEWRLLPWDAFNAEIRLFNSNILGALIHELKHRENAYAYIVLGFTISQIAQISLHDEMSARISEMLFRRNLFLCSGDLDNAFTGQAYRAGSKLLGDDFTYGFGIYKNWLLKNKNRLSAVPTTEEAMAILNAAINMISSEKAMRQYSVTIPRLVASSFRNIGSFEKYFDEEHPEIKACGFSDAVRKVYKFGNIDFFEILGTQGQTDLFSFVHTFINNKFYKKNMKSIFPYGYSAVEEKQKEFASQAGFSQISELDVENTINLSNKIIKSRRRERTK